MAVTGKQIKNSGKGNEITQTTTNEAHSINTSEDLHTANILRTTPPARNKQSQEGHWFARNK